MRWHARESQAMRPSHGEASEQEAFVLEIERGLRRALSRRDLRGERRSCGEVFAKKHEIRAMAELVLTLDGTSSGLAGRCGRVLKAARATPAGGRPARCRGLGRRRSFGHIGPAGGRDRIRLRRAAAADGRARSVALLHRRAGRGVSRRKRRGNDCHKGNERRSDVAEGQGHE